MTVIMAPTRKRSKLWNYFEELNPSLVKCTTCKKEIKIPNPTNRTKIMRAHLFNVHEIFLDNDTLSLPDDLKQYYSELPGYKAKCNNCGETVSFLSNTVNLRRHLRRHSTRILSRDETVMVPRKKRSKLWNYFKKLKPLLVKCTICKREIKVSYPTHCTKLMRMHLSRHGIFLDNDTHTLPDDLKQYYSELPGYKAKCNNCGKTLSFLTDFGNLRRHLRRPSIRIQSRDEPSTSSLADNTMDPSAERQGQDTSDLPVQSFKEKADALNVPSTSISTGCDTNSGVKCQSQETVDLDPQTCGQSRKERRARDETVIVAPKRKRSKLWNYFEKLKSSLVKCVICKIEIYMPHPSNSTAITIGHLNRHGIFLNNDTFALPYDLRQYYSELPRYKAKCNDCGKTMSFLTNIVRLRKHLRRHSTRIQSRDETVMVPRKKRSKLWNYFEELNPSLVKCTTCKKEIKVSHPANCITIMRVHLLKKHGISLDGDILTLPDNLRQCYSELPGYKAKCNNCGETVSFLTSFRNLRQHFLRRHSTIIQSQDETIIMAPRRKHSKLWNYFEELNPSLVKCTTCKKEIKTPDPTRRIKIMRIHLSRHGIYLDDDIRKLPDDLKQYYSELPEYKAKCNNCGTILSFLREFRNLRQHLRRHSTRILSRDETTPTKKRSKLWNYFEDLKPSLVKCTTCKKEIKTPIPKRRTKLMRAHILNVHGIFLDDDTRTLPDDLRQYYSELPGYKAKCNNCGKTLSFLTDFGNLRRHLRRHSIRIQSRNETTPTKKRSKLWNYFEDLKPSLVKCTTCKKEIKTPEPTTRIQIMRIHLSRHEIFLDNDTRTLPDDLRQYYSELPGYKATCNNCDKTMSFLTGKAYLRKHLRRHSILPTRIQSRDETTPTKKRSKLWNYFEDLKPSLVKCTTCKKEIKTPDLKRRIKIMRIHLSRHGIFLDNDTRTLPDDLRQYYSELPGYKAKCNNCGKTLSFLTDFGNLRRHLRRHSIRIQSRNETTPTKKRSKLWNYFEDLKPSLVKCTTCKKEIKTPEPTTRIQIMRIHLSRHEIFLDNDTRTLPDDLRQYYSELPGYKATCNNCDKTMSFLTGKAYLRKHLRRHSILPTRIQSRDEMVTIRISNLWNYFEELKFSLVKCKKCNKHIHVSNNKNRMRTFRQHLSKIHGIFLDNDTLSLPDDLKQYYSELPEYKAKCNDCGKTMSFLINIIHLRKHLRRHSTRILSQDERVMVPRKKRSKLWNYFEELNPSLVKCTTCKKEIKVSHPANCITIMRVHLLKKHGIFLDGDTLTLPDDLRQYYSELPGYKAKCNNCDKTLSFLTNVRDLRRHLRRHSIRIQSRDEPSTSSLADDSMDPSAHRQSQDTSGLLVQLFIKETTEKTDSLNKLSTSIKSSFDTNPTAKCQSQESPGLPVQSFKETAENAEILDDSAGYDMDSNAERQRQETFDLTLQSCKQSRKETRTHNGCSTDAHQNDVLSAVSESERGYVVPISKMDVQRLSTVP
ncbi:uncharacterized protein [Temnothorax nylanderi]|uniref:uncharacterized protein isoform X2 n=1 Tax=Temnothorax nylanderi TaxID=102681 RepID=UPI003A83F3DB